MLGRAFAMDPAFSHIFPDPGERARRLPLLFDLFLRIDEADGFVTTGGDGAAAALWRPPGRAHPSPWRMIAHAIELRRIFGRRLFRALALDDAVRRHHPATPLWYLHVLGCDPDAQRRGAGRAAVEAGLARIASDGLPCFLETATETNIAFYRKLGFEVVEEWALPDGPRLWGMMRG